LRNPLGTPNLRDECESDLIGFYQYYVIKIPRRNLKMCIAC